MFMSVSFEEEKVSANGIARDIAKSVLKDGGFQSFLALGGPAWLIRSYERLLGASFDSYFRMMSQCFTNTIWRDLNKN